MILPDIANRIAAMPASGFLTDESKFDYGYLYSLIHTAAAQAKIMKYGRTKKIEVAWLYPFYPEYDRLQQIDHCLYRFKLPQLITLDPRNIGLEYVGSLQKSQQFRIVTGRAKFAAMQTDRIMKNRDGINYVLIENGYCELYGDAKNFFMNGLWFDVTGFKNYNLEKDDYPVSADLIPEIEKIVLQLNLTIITKSAQDYVQNKQDNSTMVAK